MLKYLKPNKERATTAILLLALVGILDVVSFISEYFQYLMLDDVMNGGNLTIAVAEANDERQLVVAISYLVALIISAVTFINWFRRAYFNLGQRVNINRDELWAAGAWFVPIISLFWPYQIMMELYKKTAQYIRTHSQELVTTNNLTLVGLWWAFWIITNVMGQIVFRQDVETIEGLHTGSMVSMFSSVIGLVGAILAIMVVKNYTEMETKFHNINVAETTKPTPEIAPTTEEE